MMDLTLSDKVGRQNGRHLKNNPEDQGKITFLLNSIVTRQGGTAKVTTTSFDPVTLRPTFLVTRKQFNMALPNHCKDDLHESILNFQRTNRQKIGTVDGNIGKTGPTLRLLNELADPLLADDVPRPPPVIPKASGPIWQVEVTGLIIAFFSTSARLTFVDAVSGPGKPRVTFEYRFSGPGIGGAVLNPAPFSGSFNFPDCNPDDPFSGPATLEFLQVGLSAARFGVSVNTRADGRTKTTFLATRGPRADLPVFGLSTGDLALQSVKPS